MDIGFVVKCFTVGFGSQSAFEPKCGFGCFWMEKFVPRGDIQWKKIWREIQIK